MAKVTVAVTGGERLKAHLEELARKIASAKSVKVGVLAGGTYPDGTPTAMVAAIQEFGAPRVGIPPRPFLRPTAASQQGVWAEALRAALRATDGDARRALAMLGEVAAGDVRAAIAALSAPPLSEVTLMVRQMRAENPRLRVTRRTVAEARKRVAGGERASGVSTKPLVDTGNLIASIDYEVEE